jgi:hypothetical protein
VTVAIAVLVLAGCERALQTQASVTPALGNAVRANATIHAVRPHAKQVHDTSLRTDGAVTAGTLDDYRGTCDGGAQ